MVLVLIFLLIFEPFYMWLKFDNIHSHSYTVYRQVLLRSDVLYYHHNSCNLDIQNNNLHNFHNLP
jgi:hypothetical protein